MAGLFYSRYIPPAQDPPRVAVVQARKQRPKKRKRGQDLGNENSAAGRAGTDRDHEPHSAANGKGIAHQDTQIKDTKVPKPSKVHKSRGADEKRDPLPGDASIQSQELRPEEKVLEKYSVTKKRTKAARAEATGDTGARRGSGLDTSLVLEERQDSEENRPRRRADVAASDLAEEPDMEGPKEEKPETSQEQRKRKKKKKKKKATESTADVEDTNITAGLSQHPKLRSKYERLKASTTLLEPRPEPLEKISTDDTMQEVALHGLEPLPQPLIAPKIEEAPSYSALPSWMANPIRVTATEGKPFEDLPIEPQILSNLKAQNLHVALPVQSSVIPLLSPDACDVVSDICVSAPTGSGKTLAYIVPMIRALKQCAITLLRGVIVVPTRELVTQALKVCETCASGSTLKIATATGSKAIKDEKEMLMERVLKYDPEEYGRIYKKEFEPADWASFDLQALIEAVDEEEHVPDYVTRHQSKVDVLICTPGRLVDHIRSTKGFTLEHVNWFIVDEADKLLNESFQEWVDVVLPALHDRKRPSATERLLAQMRMQVPPKRVQKVILSATMTEDLSQLNSLRLHNPKLVVVGDSQATNYADLDEPHLKDESGVYHLPSTLAESGIPISDEAKKPLYLLQLLKAHVAKPTMRSPLDLKDDQANNDFDDGEDQSSSDLSESDDEASDDSDPSSIVSEASSSAVPPIRIKRSSSTSRSALIFARSSEAAARLSRLITLLEPRYAPILATLTRSSGTITSHKALTLFRQKKISILIATDRASRGLDLPDLDHVISYDVPTSVTTYVHRVGRTARAGKAGKAWTLVAHREGRWFWNEIGKGKQIVRNGKLERVNMDVKTMKKLEDGYSEALEKLGEEVKART